MDIKAIQFAALVATALALVPAGAHLLTLSNKMELEPEAYFLSQQVFRGWAWLGLMLAAALVADLSLALASRRRPVPFVLALGAAALILCSLGVFFVWTYPANQATANWTVIPDNWRILRKRWEYSHAASAALLFLALCTVVLAVLAEQRPVT